MSHSSIPWWALPGKLALFLASVLYRWSGLMLISVSTVTEFLLRAPGQILSCITEPLPGYRDVWGIPHHAFLETHSCLVAQHSDPKHHPPEILQNRRITESVSWGWSLTASFNSPSAKLKVGLKEVLTSVWEGNENQQEQERGNGSF